MTAGMDVDRIGASVRPFRQTVKASVLVELGKMDITVQAWFEKAIMAWRATKHPLGPSYLSTL